MFGGAAGRHVSVTRRGVGDAPAWRAVASPLPPAAASLPVVASLPRSKAALASPEPGRAAGRARRRQDHGRAPGAAGQRVAGRPAHHVMLEPRRLATRAAAHWMAALRGEQVNCDRLPHRDDQAVGPDTGSRW